MKQTLVQAIHLSAGYSRELSLAASMLDGKPVGNSGETTVAYIDLIGYLPHRSERGYTVQHFVDARYRVIDGYYRRRPEDEAIAEAARIEAESARSAV